jgi:hypothetical protein
MSSWYLPPAVSGAISQANRLAPLRSRRSDGTIGDAAHRSRRSDHNPDHRGAVLAFDLTHDPVGGFDAHALVEAAVRRRDPRIKYAISRGRIWSKQYAADGWRPYSGANPHQTHAHVSVDRAHENDISSWWAPPAPPAPPQEDDVARLIRPQGKNDTYGTDGTARWHVPSPPVLADLVRAGVYGDGKVTEVAQATVDALPLVDRVR